MTRSRTAAVATDFERVFGATINVPNLINRFYAQKLDTEGQAVNGAIFALYEVYQPSVEEENSNDDTIYYIGYASGSTTPVYIYLYPDDGDLTTDDGSAGNNNGRARLSTDSEITGTYVVGTVLGDITVTITGSDGSETTYIISPEMTKTTVAATNTANNGSGEDGSAMFTNVVNGTYYLREIYAPTGFSLNTTEIMVAVNDDSIMANAGTADDGVVVGRGPGYLITSMNIFASDGEIDNTLSWVYGVLKTTGVSTDFADANTTNYLLGSGTTWKYITENYWDGSDSTWKTRTDLLTDPSGTFGLAATADTDAATIYLTYDPTGDTTYDYVVNSARGIQSNAVTNAYTGANARRLFTDVGWSYLELYQDEEYGYNSTTGLSINGASYTLLDGEVDGSGDGEPDGLISALFSRSLYIQVTDEVVADIAIVKYGEDENENEENDSDDDDNTVTLAGAGFTLSYTETTTATTTDEETGKAVTTSTNTTYYYAYNSTYGTVWVTADKISKTEYFAALASENSVPTEDSGKTITYIGQGADSENVTITGTVVAVQTLANNVRCVVVKGTDGTITNLVYTPTEVDDSGTVTMYSVTATTVIWTYTNTNNTETTDDNIVYNVIIYSDADGALRFYDLTEYKSPYTLYEQVVPSGYTAVSQTIYVQPTVVYGTDENGNTTVTVSYVEVENNETLTRLTGDEAYTDRYYGMYDSTRTSVFQYAMDVTDTLVGDTEIRILKVDSDNDDVNMGDDGTYTTYTKTVTTAETTENNLPTNETPDSNGVYTATKSATDNNGVITVTTTVYTPVTDGDVTTYTVTTTTETYTPKTYSYLTGATFVLQNASGLYYQRTEKDSDAVVTWVSDIEKATPITVGENEKVTIKDLSDGAYSLVETTAPDGYNLLSDKIQITISGGEVTSVGEKATLVYLTSNDSGNTVYTDYIMVQNSSGLVLPNTGGAGTKLYIFGGLLLIAADVEYG